LSGFRIILATQPEHQPSHYRWPPGHVLGWEHAHIHLIASFLGDIVNGTTTAPTVEDGVACQRVLEAVERSAGSRQWVRIGPEGQS